MQYLSVYLFFRKTRFALVIKINKISKLSNSLQPTLNLKCTRSSHWSINKLITANDRIGDTCCRFETTTGHQFILIMLSTSLGAGDHAKPQGNSQCVSWAYQLPPMQNFTINSVWCTVKPV